MVGHSGNLSEEFINNHFDMSYKTIYIDQSQYFKTLPKNYFRKIPASAYANASFDHAIGRRYIVGTEEYFSHVAYTKDYPEVGYQAEPHKDGVNIAVPTEETRKLLGHVRYTPNVITQEAYDLAVKKHTKRVRQLKNDFKWDELRYIDVKDIRNIAKVLDNEPITLDKINEQQYEDRLFRRHVKCTCSCMSTTLIEDGCECVCHQTVIYDADREQPQEEDTPTEPSRFSRDAIHLRGLKDMIRPFSGNLTFHEVPPVKPLMFLPNGKRVKQMEKDTTVDITPVKPKKPILMKTFLKTAEGKGKKMGEVNEATVVPFLVEGEPEKVTIETTEEFLQAHGISHRSKGLYTGKYLDREYQPLVDEYHTNNIYAEEDVVYNVYVSREWTAKQMRDAIKEQLNAKVVDVEGGRVRQTYYNLKGEEYISVGAPVPVGDGMLRYKYRIRHDTLDMEQTEGTLYNRLHRAQVINHRIQADISRRKEIKVKFKDSKLIKTDYSKSALERAQDAEMVDRVCNTIISSTPADAQDAVKRLSEANRNVIGKTLSKDDVLFNVFIAMVIEGRIVGGDTANLDLPDFINDKAKELKDLIANNPKLTTLLVGSAKLLDKIDNEVDVDVTSFLESCTARRITSRNFVTVVAERMYKQTRDIERAVTLESIATGKDRYNLTLHKSSQLLRKELNNMTFRDTNILNEIADGMHLNEDGVVKTDTETLFSERRNRTLAHIMDILNAELNAHDTTVQQRLIDTANRLIKKSVTIPLNVVISLYKAVQFDKRYRLNSNVTLVVEELVKTALNIRFGNDIDTKLSRELFKLGEEILENNYTSLEMGTRIVEVIRTNVGSYEYYRSIETDDYRISALIAEDKICRMVPSLVDSNVLNESQAIRFVTETMHEVRTILGKAYYNSIASEMTVGAMSDSPDGILKKIDGISRHLAELKENLTRKDRTNVGKIELDGEGVNDFDIVDGETANRIQYRTGFTHINHVTKGGLRSGDLVVVGALSSNYKTGMTIALFVSVILYNQAPNFNTNKVYALWISLEDDAQLILRQMAQFVFFAENRFHLHADSLSAEQCFNIIKDAAAKRGWSFKFVRENASTYTYQRFFDTVTAIEDEGHAVGVCAVDYIEKQSTEGCKKGATGEDKTDLVSRQRFFAASRNMLLMSPWQLSSAAGEILKSGVDDEDFVHNVLNRPYYKGISNLNTEIDLEIIVHKIPGATEEGDPTPDCLAIGRGKAKATRGIATHELVRVYPFTKYGPLEYDVVIKQNEHGSVTFTSAGTPVTVNNKSWVKTDNVEGINGELRKREDNGFYAQGCPKGFKAGITDGETLENEYEKRKAQQAAVMEGTKETDDKNHATDVGNINAMSKRADVYAKGAKEHFEKSLEEAKILLELEEYQIAVTEVLREVENSSTKKYLRNVKNIEIVGDENEMKLKVLDEYVRVFMQGGRWVTYDEYTASTDSDYKAVDLLERNIVVKEEDVEIKPSRVIGDKRTTVVLGAEGEKASEERVGKIKTAVRDIANSDLPEDEKAKQLEVMMATNGVKNVPAFEDAETNASEDNDKAPTFEVSDRVPVFGEEKTSSFVDDV